ncbi:MAG: translation initiation factor IF-2, partial [Amphiplicatus sp.]
MGSEILDIEVSAKAKTNLDKLEEAILLQAEILDLKANPDRPAEGVIVEAKMERGRGSVATVLVQRGTLKVGDIVIAGTEWGRVRAILDAYGNEMQEAGPSVPVEVLGLNGTPAAGDEVVVVDSENRAREVCDFRQRKEREKKAAASARGTLEQMFEKIQDGSTEAKELPVVIKADVHGSVEAIVSALEAMSTEEVRIKILHAGVGGINESDVILAQASEALIIGFNVRANPQARTLARRDNVEIRYYSIIYDLTDDLKKA